MNKKIISIVSFILIACSASVFAQTKVFTADDYARAEKMLGYNTTQLVDRSGVRPTWLDDGRFWYRVLTPTGSEYVLINPADGSRTVKAEMSQLGLGLMLSAPPQGSTPIEVISPNRKLAAFIRDWNLWVRDLDTKKETQLTTDGVKDFGYATDNAGWRKSDRPVLAWSPDSTKIATFQLDQRHVSDMYLVSTNVGAPKLSAWKYPLPTDKEVQKIHRVIIDAAAPKVTRVQVAADDHRSTLCDDITCNGDFTDTEWSADSSKLAFVSTTRDHKQAKLRIADAATGAVREVLEETSPTQFESGWSTVNWRYLSASNEIIWFSERDGWGHLYLYDAATGRLKNQITTGSWVVTEVLRIDEKNRTAYFLAGGRERGRNPYHAHFYSINFDGKNLKLLTPDDGNHVISISPNGQFFTDAFSKSEVPTTVVLRDMTGKFVVNVDKTDVSRLRASGWKPPTPIVVKARDNMTDLYGLMFTPTNLDPKKKYPIVNYIYPGPQGGSIGNWNFSPAFSDHQALSELGFIIVAIEGTCNPLRSKKFHDMCYGNMADNTIEDQITGIKQLAAKYQYMDLDRVGIWGHSGGGFATADAMFNYGDFYKVGISESGNHDNLNYEDDWGERYIGLVSGDNYQKQANQMYAQNLKGKLLLAHGGMDDNVPPYNTYLVVDALIKANKDFDLLIIPNARHGYGPASFYMTRRRWDYFVRHLLGAEPPKEYELKIKQDPRNIPPK